jgi:iron complex transport system substrate-binding protein
VRTTVFRSTLVLLVTLLLSSAFASDYPLTLTDDLDRTVTLEAEPQRIVAMLPSHTETVCALGVCDRLVGIDDFSNYPEEVNELPRLGGLYDPNIEAIVALEPDLVLISESEELAGALEQAGIAVYAGSAQTFDETFETFRTLGQLVNRVDEAETLAAQVESDIDAIAQRVAGQDSPNVYYEIDAAPYSVGPESFIGVLISRAGGNNIVTSDLGDFPQLDPEFVVAADPDIIILGNAPYGESAETLAARPGWETLTAVQQGRVYELTQEEVDMVNRPGPRLAQGVLLFASIFHPELFD